MNYFSKNITYLRKKNRKTQQQVADALRVKLKRYQAWEEGRCLPRTDVFLRLCEFHGNYSTDQLTKSDLTIT